MWRDTEEAWALGLLSGYVGVKFIFAVHAGYAARAYNERHKPEERSYVDPRDVHAYIVGEHGDTEVPVWSLLNVAGLRNSARVLHGIIEQLDVSAT